MKTFVDFYFFSKNSINFKTLGFVILLMVVTAFSNNVKAQCFSILYTEDFESGFPTCRIRNNTGQFVINSNFQTNSSSFLQINGLAAPVEIPATGDINVSSESAVDIKWNTSERVNYDPKPPADTLTVEYFDGTQYVEIVVNDDSISSWQTDSSIIPSGVVLSEKLI